MYILYIILPIYAYIIIYVFSNSLFLIDNNNHNNNVLIVSQIAV